MAKNKSTLVSVSNREIVFVLLRIEKILQDLPLETRIEKEADFLDEVAWFEKRFKIDNPGGSLESRISILIHYLCPHPTELAELEEQLIAEDIKKGVVPDSERLEELEDQLERAQIAMQEIDNWATIEADRISTTAVRRGALIRAKAEKMRLVDAPLLAKNFRLGVQALSAAQKPESFSAASQVAVNKACFQTAQILSSQLASSFASVQEPAEISKTTVDLREKAPEISKRILANPEVEKAIGGLPPSARSSFVSDLKNNMPRLVTLAATDFGASLGVKVVKEEAAEQLVKLMGGVSLSKTQTKAETTPKMGRVDLPKTQANTKTIVPEGRRLDLLKARAEIETIFQVQRAVVLRDLPVLPIGEQTTVVESASLAAAQMTAQAINIKVQNPEFTPKQVANKIVGQSKEIAQEITSALPAAEQKTITSIIQSNIGNQAKITGQLVDQSVKQQTALLNTASILGKKYNLTQPQAQGLVDQSLSQQTQVLEEIFFESPDKNVCRFGSSRCC